MDSSSDFPNWKSEAIVNGGGGCATFEEEEVGVSYFSAVSKTLTVKRKVCTVVDDPLADLSILLFKDESCYAPVAHTLNLS